MLQHTQKTIIHMQCAPHAHTLTQQQCKNKKQKHIYNFIIHTKAKYKAKQDARRKTHRPSLAARRRRRINHEKFIVPVGCLRHVLLYNNNNNIANKCVCILNKQTNKC